MAKNTVRVTVVGDASSYKKSMGEAGQVTETTGQKMTTFAKVAVAALAVKALGAVKDFVGSSIDAYSDLNESLNALEVQYGDHAEGIKALGRDAATSLGLSNAEFNTFAVSLSSFAQQIAGDGGDVVDVVDTLTTRVSDFASVMNLEVADAAEKFQSGLAGESEPLRKFGIDVSAAKVEMIALAEGIWDGEEAMTEAEKVQGRYAAIMQQTEKTAGDFANTSDQLANKTRITNAQLENQKAVLGQILAPLKGVGIEMQSGLVTAVGDASIALGALTGQLSEGQAALMEFLNATGEEADSVADVVEGVALSWQSWTKEIDVWKNRLDDGETKSRDLADAFEEMLGAVELNEEGYAQFGEELESARAQGLLSKQEWEAMSAVLEEQLVKQLYATRDAARHSKGGLEEATVGVEELKEETEEATTALEDFEAEVRSQTDPLFNLVRKTDELAEAQTAVAEAVKKYKEGSPEHREALRQEYLAWEDLKAAQLRAAEESGLTREAFITNLKATSQFTQEEIDLIIADFDRVNAFKFSDKSIKINTTGPGSKLVGPDYAAAKGGSFKAGDTVLVGEEGPEIWQPKESGTIIPNNAVSGGTSIGGGAPLIIHVHGSVITENELADLVQKVLLKKQKRNGGLGLVG